MSMKQWRAKNFAYRCKQTSIINFIYIYIYIYPQAIHYVASSLPCPIAFAHHLLHVSANGAVSALCAAAAAAPAAAAAFAAPAAAAATAQSAPPAASDVIPASEGRMCLWPT